MGWKGMGRGETVGPACDGNAPAAQSGRRCGELLSAWLGTSGTALQRAQGVHGAGVRWRERGQMEVGRDARCRREGKEGGGGVEKAEDDRRHVVGGPKKKCIRGLLQICVSG
jgi:hypothetical protein